jgi:predicted dehydrogenase
MSRRTNRRQFIRESTLAGVGFWVAGGLAPKASRAAIDTINIACIGVGGKGSSDTDHAGQVGTVVALCDIDDNHLNAKAQKFPQARKYNDYRKMLEEMGKGIDAVTVSTPDHTHAPASLMAMKLGKHVYCQKPLCHDVAEARAMRETAAEKKVATQMGNQGTANRSLRTGVEVIQSGALGPVKEVHVWTNRPIWPQGTDAIFKVASARNAALAALHGQPPSSGSRPSAPPHVHWDLFLGTAPERPYDPIYHPFSWRGWWDYGTGALGDMACHTMNMPFMALKLGYPDSVVGQCGELNTETYPTWATVTYQFPARGELPPVKLVWYEGVKDGKKNLPPQELLQGEAAGGSASLIIGEKGTMYSPADYGERWVLLPKKQFEGYTNPQPTLPRFEGRDDDLHQKMEWAAAIKGGPKSLANFDYAGLLAETVLLGNVALRAQGKKLEWDGSGLKFKNDSTANQYLKREYRKSWTL